MPRNRILSTSRWSISVYIIFVTCRWTLGTELVHSQLQEPSNRELMVLDSLDAGRFNQSGVLTAVAVIHPVRAQQKHASSSLSPSTTSSTRQRRDIFHLYNMMSCTTQCDPLSYKGYGCYCGFLGSGLTVDAIDRCCKKHDYCYGATPCRHQSLIYFVPYKWKCNGGHPYCVVPYGELKANDICAHHLCECDRQFAECLRYLPCPGKKATCPSNPLRSLG